MSLWDKMHVMVLVWLLQRFVSMGRRCDKLANACATKARSLIPSGVTAPPKL